MSRITERRTEARRLSVLRRCKRTLRHRSAPGRRLDTPQSERSARMHSGVTGVSCDASSRSVATWTRRAWNGLLSCLLAVSCVLAPVLAPQAAADVRKADVVMGSSIDSRGLNVAQCPNINAEYAIVVDDEGTVYFERNATTQTQIASITKIMTAVIALENVSLDTPVVVDYAAAHVGESSAELMEGDVLDMKAALTALLVSSGNDAAIAIAETVGASLGGEESAQDAFVAAMNAKALEIGCTGTLFDNPHGLDYDRFSGNMYSTATDVALMARYAMQNDTFRTIVAQIMATIQVTGADGVVRTLELESTDQLIGVYEGACGIKTGFTALAGQSFAGACERDGHTLYAIVLNSSSEIQRFTDAQTLFDWVYEHEIDYPLAHSSRTTNMVLNGQSIQVPVIAEVAHTDWIDATVKATLADPDAYVTVFNLNGNVSQSLKFDELTGDVHTGDKVGTITFKQRNSVLATLDLVACEDVLAPTLFEDIGVWWDRLFRGFSGAQQVAQSVTLNETPLVNDKTTDADL